MMILAQADMNVISEWAERLTSSFLLLAAVIVMFKMLKNILDRRDKDHTAAITILRSDYEECKSNNERLHETIHARDKAASELQTQYNKELHEIRDSCETRVDTVYEKVMAYIQSFTTSP